MSNVIAFMRDSLTSLVSRMGTERDKAATTFYAHTVLSDEQLIAAYSTSWLPRKIVDIPALDACRKWRDWQAKKPQIEAIEEEEKRLNVKGKILEASKKGRLFGGAAVYIGIGDEDPSQPLDDAEITGMFKAIAKDVKTADPFARVVSDGLKPTGDAHTQANDAWNKSVSDLNAWRKEA
ncbi:DUF1073 domain-containing protein [Sinorhizobium meliloti]|nr:DUF1073 domain-containing protein [Sinorhizobium meliloti]RVO18028.1 DUF1073 domain-containing protein [Sinorhizobium meliloti]RVO40790.1 DUF1073 domain-containing protein [Sinorhizobium meliloti]